MADDGLYLGTSVRGITEEIEIPVPWGIVAAKVYGDSNGLPVLCIHGWLDNCNTFDTLIPFLSKDRFYVFIDLPGHGKSSAIPIGSFYSIFDYVALVDRIRRYFSWSHFSMLSHSLVYMWQLATIKGVIVLMTQQFASTNNVIANNVMSECFTGGNISGPYAGTFPEKVDKLIIMDVLGIPFYGEGSEVNMLRSSIESYAKHEVESDRVPRSYSYDVAKEKLLKANTSLTSHGADVLLERGAMQQADGTYIFRRDIRHNFRDPVVMNMNSGMKFATKIEAETLHIIAKSGILAFLLNESKVKETASRVIPEGFKACEYHKRVDVPGKHHVHLCRPENVSDEVTSFLNRPVRAGILQTRSQSAAKL